MKILSQGLVLIETKDTFLKPLLLLFTLESVSCLNSILGIFIPLCFLNLSPIFVSSLNDFGRRYEKSPDPIKVVKVALFSAKLEILILNGL